jgi:dihydroorotate dehydrogenase
MGLFWEKIMRPAMFALDAERAHEFGIWALSAGLARPFYSSTEEFELGPIERFGLRFRSPVGVAAGFDKNGTVFEPLGYLGFGFVEVGTVTYKPQKGNEKPRLFRLPKDMALINRLGFNNEGAGAVARRVRNRKSDCVIGINIGKNKDIPNEGAVENYLECFEIVHPPADYIAVNVSSPNTPDLRKLQAGNYLEKLLSALQTRNRDLGAKPLLVKIAPDLTVDEIESIVNISMKLEIAGIIATNTTVERTGLLTENVRDFGEGGLSGRPLYKRSNEIISRIYRYSKGQIPIIGVGGIFTPEDAFEKIAAGASLVQTYTGFVYGGPRFARVTNRGLSGLMKSRGFSNFEDLIGSAVI